MKDATLNTCQKGEKKPKQANNPLFVCAYFEEKKIKWVWMIILNMNGGEYSRQITTVINVQI